MAYTKIHAIKATVDKAIEYICNPDKTDEQIYISSYACAHETVAINFKYTLDHCRENRPNKAYHLIPAFAPGEVGYEEAHRIGKELADKILPATIHPGEPLYHQYLTCRCFLFHSPFSHTDSYWQK